MIGRLKGKILHRQPPELLIDVNGVGYEVSAPMTTFYQLAQSGEAVLYTHLAVREDAQQLFGFASLQQRDLFRLLIKVNGVGPKMALAILSGMEFDDLVAAVSHDDVSALVRIPGVGKKTAERLLIEMRDKFKAFQAGPLFAEPLAGVPQQDALADAESAMVALGYKAAQASKAVKKVYQQGMNADEIIRQALKQMV